MEQFAKETLPISLEEEMRRSYLDYAMSVIVGRALPDVRDGLKPVHRRILFAMHESNTVWNRPYVKCARVVGDVLEVRFSPRSVDLWHDRAVFHFLRSDDERARYVAQLTAALKPGGKAEFFIPPSLGYGTMGGGGVPAGAGLIFEVELIALNPEPQPKS